MDGVWDDVAAAAEALPAERRARLDKAAAFVASKAAAGSPAPLVFVCTHNSRRSHLGQVLAAAAAAYVGVPGVQTHSAGTEATAFNANAVRALEANGCSVRPCSSRDELLAAVPVPQAAEGVDLAPPGNPVLLVTHTPGAKPSVCFSKTLDHPSLPKSDFCALMTCDSADAACPVIKGAAARVAIPYTDPKASDGTGKEAQVYSDKVREIAAEMLYLMREAKKAAAA
ncbi:protein-tyrosine-phosphatase [Hyaloraphidium curvatum]|nr:protein-tyrosine-phosphatase [Hyaloraphidium curvatum]